MGVNVSQMTRVKPSDYFRLHPTSMISKHSNNPDSWHSLYTAWLKLVLPSILTQVFHSWWCETCRVCYTTTLMNERMWHFRGLKHTLNPPAYFQGVKMPRPTRITLLKVGATLEPKQNYLDGIRAWHRSYTPQKLTMFLYTVYPCIWKCFFSIWYSIYT